MCKKKNSGGNKTKMPTEKTDQDELPDESSNSLSLRVVIIVLILMIVFGAASSKGMYQYGCSTNANMFWYFVANLLNSLTFGGYGLFNYFRYYNSTFELKTK
tara:strand:- start:593 stop:898 length:306 start_codon:yes stop_codon:yes gene_type:complete